MKKAIFTVIVSLCLAISLCVGIPSKNVRAAEAANTEVVTNRAGFLAAMDDPNVDIIKLGANFNETSDFRLEILAGDTKGYEFTLDLNGYIINSELDFRNDLNSNYGFDVEIIDSSVGKTGRIGGTTQVLDEATDFDNWYGIFVKGHDNINLTLTGITLQGAYGGLYTNGSFGGDTTITATDCKFIGINDVGGTGAYLVSNYEYEFTDCKFTGNVGLHTKSGSYTFTNCDFTSNNSTYVAPSYNGSGSNPASSALVLECTTGGYGDTLDVTVNGGSFTSASGYGIEKALTSANASTAKRDYLNLTIEGDPVFDCELGETKLDIIGFARFKSDYANLLKAINPSDLTVAFTVDMFDEFENLKTDFDNIDSEDADLNPTEMVAIAGYIPVAQAKVDNFFNATSDQSGVEATLVRSEDGDVITISYKKGNTVQQSANNLVDWNDLDEEDSAFELSIPAPAGATKATITVDGVSYNLNVVNGMIIIPIRFWKAVGGTSFLPTLNPAGSVEAIFGEFEYIVTFKKDNGDVVDTYEFEVNIDDYSEFVEEVIDQLMSQIVVAGGVFTLPAGADELIGKIRETENSIASLDKPLPDNFLAAEAVVDMSNMLGSNYDGLSDAERDAIVAQLVDAINKYGTGDYVPGAIEGINLERAIKEATLMLEKLYADFDGNTKGYLTAAQYTEVTRLYNLGKSDIAKSLDAKHAFAQYDDYYDALLEYMLIQKVEGYIDALNAHLANIVSGYSYVEITSGRFGDIIIKYTARTSAQYKAANGETVSITKGLLLQVVDTDEYPLEQVQDIYLDAIKELNDELLRLAKKHYKDLLDGTDASNNKIGYMKDYDDTFGKYSQMTDVVGGAKNAIDAIELDADGSDWEARVNDVLQLYAKAFHGLDALRLEQYKEDRIAELEDYVTERNYLNYTIESWAAFNMAIEAAIAEINAITLDAYVLVIPQGSTTDKLYSTYLTSTTDSYAIKVADVDGEIPDYEDDLYSLLVGAIRVSNYAQLTSALADVRSGKEVGKVTRDKLDENGDPVLDTTTTPPTTVTEQVYGVLVKVIYLYEGSYNVTDAKRILIDREVSLFALDSTKDANYGTSATYAWNSNLRMVGNGNASIIKGAVVDSSNSGENNSLIVVAASNVTIYGLTVENSATTKDNYTIYVRAGNTKVIIRDNVILGTRAMGVYFGRDTSGEILNNLIGKQPNQLINEGIGARTKEILTIKNNIINSKKTDMNLLLADGGPEDYSNYKLDNNNKGNGDPVVIPEIAKINFLKKHEFILGKAEQYFNDNTSVELSLEFKDAADKTYRDLVNAAIGDHNALHSSARSILTTQYGWLVKFDEALLDVEIEDEIAKKLKVYLKKDNADAADDIVESKYTVDSWAEFTRLLDLELTALRGMSTLAQVKMTDLTDDPKAVLVTTITVRTNAELTDALGKNYNQIVLDGTFVLSTTLEINRTVELLGASGARIESSATPIIKINATNVVIRNLTIVGTSTATSGITAIEFAASSSGKILNNWIGTATASAIDTAIKANTTGNVEIKDNIIGIRGNKAFDITDAGSNEFANYTVTGNKDFAGNDIHFDDKLIAIFMRDHGAVLAITIDEDPATDVVLGDHADVNAAYNAYDALPASTKALLADAGEHIAALKVIVDFLYAVDYYTTKIQAELDKINKTAAQLAGLPTADVRTIANAVDAIAAYIKSLKDQNWTDVMAALEFEAKATIGFGTTTYVNGDPLDFAELDALIAAYKAELIEISLQLAKDDAIADLETLRDSILNGDYFDIDKDEIDEYFNDVLEGVIAQVNAITIGIGDGQFADLDAATAEIDRIVDEAEAKIASYMTKTAIRAQVSFYTFKAMSDRTDLLNNYCDGTTEAKNAIGAIYTTFISELTTASADLTGSTKAFNAAVEKYENAIFGIKSAYIAGLSKIAEEGMETIIDELKGDDKYEDYEDELNEILEDYKELLGKVTTPDGIVLVIDKFTDAIKAFKKLIAEREALKVAKESAKNQLKVPTDVEDADGIIAGIVDEYKGKIDAATSTGEVSGLLSEAKAKIEREADIQRQAIKDAKAIEDAIEELEDLDLEYSNNSKIRDIINAYLDKLAKAKNEADANRILSEAEQAIAAEEARQEEERLFGIEQDTTLDDSDWLLSLLKDFSSYSRYALPFDELEDRILAMGYSQVNTEKILVLYAQFLTDVEYASSRLELAELKMMFKSNIQNIVDIQELDLGIEEPATVDSTPALILMAKITRLLKKDKVTEAEFKAIHVEYNSLDTEVKQYVANYADFVAFEAVYSQGTPGYEILKIVLLALVLALIVVLIILAVKRPKNKQN